MASYDVSSDDLVTRDSLVSWETSRNLLEEGCRQSMGWSDALSSVDENSSNIAILDPAISYDVSKNLPLESVVSQEVSKIQLSGKYSGPSSYFCRPGDAPVLALDLSGDRRGFCLDFVGDDLVFSFWYVLDRDGDDHCDMVEMVGESASNELSVLSIPLQCSDPSS